MLAIPTRLFAVDTTESTAFENLEQEVLTRISATLLAAKEIPPIFRTKSISYHAHKILGSPQYGQE